MSILNVRNALIQERPDFMTLVKVGATQRKIDGVPGVMKFVPWITFITFKIESADQITQYAEMSFWPNTTDSYDTKPEALSAAKEFIAIITAQKAIFQMIWDEWATE